MSVSITNSNAFLDSFAAQINLLEQDSNATPDYDAALDKQFQAVKAQVLGVDAHDPGASPRPPGQGQSGGGITGPVAAAPPPPEHDSIGVIASTAGADAAAAVQDIADHAAASIGGTDGTAVADAAAGAGASAAQQVIASDGTPAAAGAAARAAAQSVATAGAAGGPTAATTTAQITATVDPATAQGISAIADGTARLLGGLPGAGAAAAVTQGGLNAARAAAGASAAGIADAGTTGAQAVADAVAAIKNAGGTPAQLATNVAEATDAVADAAEFGGAEAATSAATAAAQAGPAAARAVATAAQNASKFAAGAGDVTAAAVTAGASAAQDAAITIGVATGFGMGAANAALAGGVIATAAANGGAALASAVAPAVNSVAAGRGTVADMNRLAGEVTRAFDVHGVDGAQAVTNAITQLVEAKLVPNATVDFDTIGDIADAVSSAVVVEGPNVAADAVTAAKLLLAAGGTAADMQNGAKLVASSFSLGGEDQANATIEMFQNIAMAGGNAAEMQQAAKLVSDSFDLGGPDLVKSTIEMSKTVQAVGGSAADIQNAGKLIADNLDVGGQDLVDTTVQMSDTIRAAGGDAADIAIESNAVKNAFTHGSGQASADAMLTAAKNATASTDDGAVLKSVLSTTESVAVKGASPGEIISAGEHIAAVFNKQGAETAATAASLIQSASARGVPDMVNFATVVSEAAYEGGDQLATQVADLANAVVENGGSDTNMYWAGKSLVNAFTSAGDAGVNALLVVEQAVADGGGSISNMLTMTMQTSQYLGQIHLSTSQDAAVQLANLVVHNVSAAGGTLRDLHLAIQNARNGIPS